jgi:hypothetical protein
LLVVGKVRMIHQVGERGFEPQAQAFTEMESFGETGGNRRGAGAKENPTPQFPTGPEGTGLNAPMLNRLPLVAMLPLPTQILHRYIK